MDEKDKKFIKQQQEFLLQNPILRKRMYTLLSTDQHLVSSIIKLREVGIYSIRHFFVGMMLLLLDDNPDVLRAIETLKTTYKEKYRKTTLSHILSKQREKIEGRLFELTDEELDDFYNIVEIEQGF